MKFSTVQVNSPCSASSELSVLSTATSEERARQAQEMKPGAWGVAPARARAGRQAEGAKGNGTGISWVFALQWWWPEAGRARAAPTFHVVVTIGGRHLRRRHLGRRLAAAASSASLAHERRPRLRTRLRGVLLCERGDRASDAWMMTKKRGGAAATAVAGKKPDRGKRSFLFTPHIDRGGGP